MHEIKQQTVSAAMPWIELQNYSHKHSYFMRDFWLKTEKGRAFKLQVDAILSQPGVGSEFRCQTYKALFAADVEFLDFFHSIKVHRIFSVFRAGKIPAENRVYISNQNLMVCESSAWNKLEKLYLGPDGPIEDVVQQVERAVKSVCKLNPAIHHFRAVERLRKIFLTLWRDYELYRKDRSVQIERFGKVTDTRELEHFINSAETNMAKIRQIAHDVRALGMPELQKLYGLCCASINEVVSPVMRRANAAGITLQVKPQGHCEMSPTTSLSDYQIWLRHIGPAKSRTRLMMSIAEVGVFSRRGMSPEAVWDRAMSEERVRIVSESMPMLPS